MIIKRTSQK